LMLEVSERDSKRVSQILLLSRTTVNEVYRSAAKVGIF
jgi:hypothetical protein